MPAVEALLGEIDGAVAGEAVVQFEGGPRESAPVHGADDDPVLQRTEEQQVLQDVGTREHPVDAGAGQGEAEAFEQVEAVGHGQAVVADGEGAAGRMVGGDDHQSSGGAEERASAAGPCGLGDGLGVVGAEPDEIGDAARGGRGHGASPVAGATRPSARACSTSCGKGIAEEQASREATMAPAALA